MSALSTCPHCGERLTPQQEPLTTRQAEILAFVRDSVDKRGYAPTHAEIADGCNLRSLASVSDHLGQLQRKGYITRSFNRRQGIALVEASV